VLDAPLRPVRFFAPGVELTPRPDGSLLMRSSEPLADYDHRIGDWVDRWARDAPGRVFLVEQLPQGERAITYREARDSALVLAQNLLDYGLSAERPLAILAPNSIDHAIVMLAALYVGIPVAPIAPAYALQTGDFSKLAHSFRLLTPGMVIVEDGALYAKAIRASLDPGVPVVAFRNAEPSLNMRSLASLQHDVGALNAVANAAAQVSRETIAKFLFTSGSTGVPKAVINTHGMLCANAQMKRQIAPVLADEPPVMVDWAPWNHTAGGNSNFNIALYHGGTLYIDPGKPTPALIGASIELLRRVAPTIYFNVPRGFELLIPYLESDQDLRNRFFSRLKFIWYAAASMLPATWYALEKLAVETVGQRILTVTGLGMTETSPIALFGNEHANGPGVVGVPAAGLGLKLAPHDESFEVGYRGPNVTPGYWRDAEATRLAFDADGFFCSGDLLSFIDRERPGAGLRFDGRIKEDFKLSSGTKVSAGKLRLDALDAMRPLASDIVIVGADRTDVRILIFPDWEVCARAAGLSRASSSAEIVASAPLRTELQKRLESLAATGTGSSNRVVAALLVETPPSHAAGELTEKGTVNSRVLQRNRPELLEILYDDKNSKVLRVPRASVQG